MTTSITGGQLVFNAGTFLNRGLNLLDATDPGACRANLGLTGVLTIGNGIVASSGTYSPTASATISVNTTTNATPSSIASYDANGNLTVASTLNFGTGATMTRSSGTNGAMALTNTGSGVFSLNNGNGVIQLVTGSTFQLTAAGANPSTITTNAGLAVGLTNGAVGTGLTVTGGLNADSLSGSAISDSTTGTSSTIAASTKAVATVSTAASAAQTAATAAQSTASAAQATASAALPSSGGTVIGAVTFNSGLTIGANQLISHPELVYTAHNGGTTAPSSIVQFGGATYFGLPGTTAVEAKNDYGATGLDATGLFTAPITGRYFYSYTYSGSASTTLTVYKNNGSSNAAKQRVGTGTQLSVTGSLIMNTGHTLWAALGVTSTLNANFNNIYIQLLV